MTLRLFSFILLALSFLSTTTSAQVCDDLIVNGCESRLSSGWTKIVPCNNGKIRIQYCHPRFFVGSGHNLTVIGGRQGRIIFKELLEKKTLSSGTKARKAIGKNARGQTFTGIFSYNKTGKINGCYIKAGADRSQNIVIPR